ncbi:MULTISPECIES: PTS trehalose transporter subunit IIBC [unclassified Clostridioides]|uniref:PTS trehalose transporter subunit IIBC n=1 Tax=unclassified Clostridioides TaxID=2635829 RepID=UPI001D0C6EBA|nr:PTS trehalose transporter subunit IIBC [Clostridioides sp. ES-S-0001-02]MCC0640697.1 PTS trehalose transporter subunit IIBC [Clostridioides sp. ES-S-0049-03]MCC0653238.1 PTS trehalose transporter subunit IIBC [Clostridioides sp. ES-S-0001-03]MCC0656754.1 PTS trehalose transporter subunit IIBC [Clostridioides sp. ES-S-0123-01]MCC0672144.1 PTS trehalose transporter subunit IIBC [Clostridioides sp. ES-S-0145-01]MCC0676133.1 PTS trehalose transporter subunit IIBC [Clostridioides sp. ES-W-0018-0
MSTLKENTYHKEQVEQILEAIGGVENIISATHCITRLRFALNSESKVNVKQLEQIDIVKGSFTSNGQFQVIIGPGLVNKVYATLIEITGLKEATKSEVKEISNKKLNPLQKAIKVLADIFIPILPAIVASGLLMGINNLLANPGIFYEQPFLEVHSNWAGISNMINLIANTSFSFLPALIGWSAVKKFGGNPVLGIVLGLILINPDLMPGAQYSKTPEAVTYWNILGFNIAKIGYQGQVIPVLCSSYLLATIEKFLTKKIPEMVQLIFVAPLTLLITGFLTFSIIGPITMSFANLITSGILGLFEINAVLAGALFGFILSPLVITGMHHLFLGINLQMIGTLGFATLWPIQVMASLGQGAAALTMFFILKNKKIKGVALTASISAWLGITEPAIFGINLRYRFPFIASMIGAGIAGGVVSYFNVKASSIGISGLPAFLSIFTDQWGVYFLAMGLSIAITCILTYIFSKSKYFNKEFIEN